MEDEKECVESEKIEGAKTDCNYNPAGNTNRKKEESDSKTDEFGKRKRHVDGSKKVNPSS